MGGHTRTVVPGRPSDRRASHAGWTDQGPPRSAAAFLAALPVGLVAPSDGLDFWLPMGFIIAGFLLFLWEVSMPGFFIAIPATVAIVLGVIGMFVEGFFTSPWVVLVGVLVTLPVTALTIRLYRRLAPPNAAPTTTTAEALVGREGTVTVEIDPETTRGKVRIGGVVWSATSEEVAIPVGRHVTVLEIRGVHVLVAPIPKRAPRLPPDTEPSKPDHAEPARSVDPTGDERPSDAPSPSRP